jgi:uncharacterized phage infection (PIP) family protein YhgE
MIQSLPYILISLLALTMIVLIFLLVRGYRRSITALEDRLQALESEQLRIDQAMADNAAKNTEENAARVTKLKEDIKTFFTSAMESLQKKTAANAAAYENQLDLLSAQIMTLQQSNLREPAPVEAPVIPSSVQPMEIPAAQSIEPAEIHIDQPVQPAEIQVDQPVQPEEILVELPVQAGEEVPPAQAEQPAKVDQADLKARRLARLIVSEIALYNKKALEEGVRTDTFSKLLEHDIKEAHALYARRVPEEIRNATSYLEEAFTELIAKTRRELNL